MNRLRMNSTKILAALEVAALPVMLVVVSCGSDPAATSYTQIEHLARPGINELLVIKNASHESFNKTAPMSLDSAITTGEIVPVLQALDTVNSNSANTPPVAEVASGFLPDVMRISTNDSDLTGAVTGYGNCLSSTNKILCGGRRIEDDVINISYSYLVTGNPSAGADDGVTYNGDTSLAATGCTSAKPNGTNAAAPGHRCLHGQTTRNAKQGAFPFLAAPH